MFFILIQNNTCGTLPFDRMPGPTEYAMSYTITEHGMEKFIGCGIKGAMSFATQIPIPDMDFDISLGITSIHMSLSDIHMTDLTVNAVRAMILENEDNTVTAELLEANLALSMRWSFMEDAYPFLSD